MVTEQVTQNKPITPVKCNGGYLDKTGFSGIENLGKHKISIVIDWFQVFGICRELPAPVQGEVMEFGDVALAYTGHGSELFECVFDVYLEGEKVAVLQQSPRHTLAEGSAMLKLENYLFYYEDWHTIFVRITDTLHFVTKSVTRLDVAIDGSKDIVPFLNQYLKQTDSQIKMKGKATFKTNFEASSQNFTWFQVGSSASNKCISIYNKTKEIEQSNKIYIKRFWENNELDTENDIYRVELRLRSKGCKDVSGFDVDKLSDSTYLASLCKTHFENFFEFVHNKDTNISRCESVQLIDWDMLGACLLEKIDKKQVNDRYKAKLTIHLLMKLHYQDLISDALKSESMPYIEKLLCDFDLRQWYAGKLSEWKDAYYLPTNKRIVKEHIKSQLARAGFKVLGALDYIRNVADLKMDYSMCKKQGFWGDWHKFLEIVQAVCNELAMLN